MSKQKQSLLRRGFSLIELLIVIFIISLVYYLGFSGVELGTQKPKALTPMNLKETIVQSSSFSKEATFMCLDKCKECYLRQGLSSAFQKYENNIDLNDIKAYTIDADDSLRRIEYERYDDKKICLVMHFHANGSSTQIILENEEGTYFLPAFFGESKKFDSPEDAKDYWLEKSRLVSNAGDFY